MAIPQWLSITIAALVIVFGGYRLWLAVAGPSDEERAKHRRGMLAMSRRSNGLVAILYFIVGAALLASSFGWTPWRTRSAAPPTAPTDKPGSGSVLPVTP